MLCSKSDVTVHRQDSWHNRFLLVGGSYKALAPSSIIAKEARGELSLCEEGIYSFFNGIFSILSYCMMYLHLPGRTHYYPFIFYTVHLLPFALPKKICSCDAEHVSVSGGQKVIFININGKLSFHIYSSAQTFYCLKCKFDLRFPTGRYDLCLPLLWELPLPADTTVKRLGNKWILGLGQWISTQCLPSMYFSVRAVMHIVGKL